MGRKVGEGQAAEVTEVKRGKAANLLKNFSLLC